MTDDEALRKSREAIEDARSRVGDNEKLLGKEIEARISRDPETMEAFARTGRLILDAAQAAKH